MRLTNIDYERLSLLAEFLQHLRFDVAAADDRDGQLARGELVGMEDESGGSDCATGFGHCIRICAEVLHREADFIFGNGDDVVDISADVFEVKVADALRAEPVGEG